MTDAEIEKIAEEIIKVLEPLPMDERIKILKAVAILNDIKGVFVTRVDIVE